MFPPHFTPIEITGMSVITAGCLSFLVAGAGVFFWWNQREHTRIHDDAKDGFVEINGKATVLFDKIDNTNEDLSEIKSHIAGMHESLSWIQKYMESKLT